MPSQTASRTPSAPQLLCKPFQSALTGTRREYWLYLPRGYGDDDRRWPVILFLHGGGERGDDPDVVLKHGPLKEVANGRELPFLILGPQMPARPSGARDAGRRRTQWAARPAQRLARERARPVGHRRDDPGRL